MKILIQRNLCSELVSKVADMLVKGDSPTDVCQYLGLEAKGDNISFYVVRKDVVSVSSISVSSVGALAKIEKEGNCMLPGELTVGTLLLGEQNDVLSLSFDPLENSKKITDKDDKDSEVEIKDISIGKLTVTYDGSSKKKQKHVINCVEAIKCPVFEIDNSSEITMFSKDFIRSVKFLGISVGKATMSQVFATMRINIVGSKMTFASTNGQHCSIAEIDKSLPQTQSTFTTKKDIIHPYKLNYDIVSNVAKGLNKDDEVSLLESKGRFIIKQPIKFGGAKIGESRFSIAYAEKFAQIDSLIEKTDFKFTCKVNKSQLKLFCEKLALGTKVFSDIVFDPDNSQILVSKRDSYGEMEISLPILDGKGGSLSLSVSSRFLEVGTEFSENDNIILSFSGKDSLAMTDFGNGLKHYFAPFPEGNRS